MISAALGLAALLAATEAAAEGPRAMAAPPPEPALVDLGLHLGGVYRVDDAPAYPITGRAGVSFGATAYLAPSRRYAFGLGFEHAGLGHEKAEGDYGSAEIRRGLDVLWASIRVTFVHTDVVDLDLAIGPGFAWQGVSASGFLTPGIGKVPATFACSASDSLNLALRAGLGARVALGSGVSFLADVGFDNVRLGSDVIGDCAPGAGTVSLFGARLGFSYTLDVTHSVR